MTFAIVRGIGALFNFYSMLIVAYCFLTWIPMRPGGLMSDIAAVLDSLVGPFLNIFRRILPPMAGIDFTPVIAVLALNLIERLLIGIIL